MNYVNIFGLCLLTFAVVCAQSEWERIIPMRISTLETQATRTPDITFEENRTIQSSRKASVTPIINPVKRKTDKNQSNISKLTNLSKVKNTTESPTSKTLPPSPRGGKIKKKYQKYMLPLLLAYKLKFFTLIPVMIGGLVLLAGSTGLAGFFFALFAAVMGLRSTGGAH